MQDSVIQQIKDKLDVVDVVGGYLKLQKTGINFRANCPFHSEKKPSFFVSPARQSWRCFGCGVGGSVFDFVMQIEGIEFGDALKILAQRAGVELKTFQPELKTERQRLYEICELACLFFEKQLESKEGKEVERYLLKRGVKSETIKKWRIGFAPDSWCGLSDFLVGNGYTREETVKAGLAVNSEKGGTPYDRFRKRIVFPVFDLNSQVIGFGARVLEGSEETAKYINTPNTLLYDKSQVVFGLNFAKLEIRKKDFVVLTEGYMDTILLHQAGFENTIASSGTALTPMHLKILKRYTSKVYTAFDMDIAGGVATSKGITLAQKEDFEIKVIRMPGEKDPADVISRNPEDWQKILDSAINIFDFYFESAFSKFDRDLPEGKKEISKILLPKIKGIPNKIVQAHWVQRFALETRIGEESVWEEMKSVRAEMPADSTNSDGRFNGVVSAPPVSAAAASAPLEKIKNRKEMIEERALSLIFKNPSAIRALDEELLEFFSEDMKTIFNFLKKENLASISAEFEESKKAVLKKGERSVFDESRFNEAEQEKSKKISGVLEKIGKKSDNIKKIIDTAFLMMEVSDFGSEKGEASEYFFEEFEICLEELKKIFLRSRLEKISLEIRKAEIDKDEKRLEKLSGEFNDISKKMVF